MITYEFNSGNGESQVFRGDHYHCRGSVRGDCGHKHRTLGGAISCLRRDQSGCASQGGYSDRSVMLGDDYLPADLIDQACGAE